MSAPVRSLRLLVLPLVATEHLHLQDRACAGIYQGNVPAHWDDNQAHASVMDSFHQQIHPCRPDDFSYQVWEQDHQLKPSEPVLTTDWVVLTKQTPRGRPVVFVS